MTFKGLKSLLCVKCRKSLNEHQMRGNRLRKIRAICYQGSNHCTYIKFQSLTESVFCYARNLTVE